MLNAKLIREQIEDICSKEELIVIDLYLILAMLEENCTDEKIKSCLLKHLKICREDLQQIRKEKGMI